MLEIFKSLKNLLFLFAYLAVTLERSFFFAAIDSNIVLRARYHFNN